MSDRLSTSELWSLPPAIPSLFAKLTPANDAARKAFSRLAGLIQDGNGDGGGAGKFVMVDEEKGRVVEWLGEDGEEGREVKREIWTGGWGLDFEVPPGRVERGWIIGGGNPRDRSGYPDIILTERMQSDGVRPQHASLVHNYTSGALLIIALEGTITLDGTESLEQGQRLIYKRRTSVEVGNLKYILSLEPISSLDHRTLLTTYKTTHALTCSNPPSNLTLTPSEWDRPLAGYILKNAIGHGITGLVSAALDRTTGACVAIKTYRRYTDLNDLRLEADWTLAERIGWHPNICQLIAIVSPAAEDAERGYRARCGVDEAFCVYAPLASWTVEKLVDADAFVTSRQCVGLLTEWVEGVAWLHGRGVMHRDVKPSNLTVLALEPPRAQLIDFGHALEALWASDADVGTPGWRAPELEALVGNPKARGGYDESVDLFGLGVSVYRLFCQVRGRWWEDRIREPDVQRMGAQLLKLDMVEGVARLLVSFMEWDPKMRPKAKKARDGLRWLCERHGSKADGNDCESARVWGQEEGLDLGSAVEKGHGKSGKKGRRSAW